jgi:hypothetical protein
MVKQIMVHISNEFYVAIEREVYKHRKNMFSMFLNSLREIFLMYSLEKSG